MSHVQRQAQNASDDANVDSSVSALGKVLQACVLCITELISKKECTVQSSEAEQLMADLETILDSARDKASSVPPPNEGVDSNESERDKEALRHLKRMKHMICCAQSPSINKGIRKISTSLLASGNHKLMESSYILAVGVNI